MFPLCDRSGKEAMVLNARRGAVVAKLTAQDPVASVQGVAVTKEYFLLICRYIMNNVKFSHSLELNYFLQMKALQETHFINDLVLV